MQNETKCPKPPCALRIGVVGNRRFAKEEQPGAVDRQMKERAKLAMIAVWQAFFQSIHTVLDETLPLEKENVCMRDLFAAGIPRVAVLTSLAAGADQIGARTALIASEGFPIELELEAVLPFSEKDYPGIPDETRSEFRPDEAEELRDLLTKACQVVRLSGKYTEDKKTKEQGYRQARDLLLQNADLLIAIYNPERESGGAGTRETVNHALRNNTPVIALLVHNDRDPEIAFFTKDDQISTAAGFPDWPDHILKYIRQQIVLPEALALSVKVDEDDAKDGRDTLTHAIHRLRLLSGDAQPSILKPRWLFERIWVWLRMLSTSPTAHQCKHPNPDQIADKITMKPYQAFYDKASDLSRECMRTYRGAFVLAYFLAGLAVMAAVTILATALLYHKHAPLPLIVALALVKIGIICGLMLLESRAHEGRFHEIATDFRYLAELLRPMQWLAPVGVYPPSVELPLHEGPHDPRRSWMAWVARSVSRSTPSVAIRAQDGFGDHPKEVSIDATTAATTLERARDEWLAGQVIYHCDNEHKMDSLEHGLELWAKRLLLFVLIWASIALLFEIPYGLHLLRKPFDEGARTTAVILGSFAAFLPAFIAALVGIKFQSEAKRLASRSKAMLHAISLQQEDLTRAAAALRASDGAEASSRVSHILKKLSAETIEEAGGWKVLYQVHPIQAA